MLKDSISLSESLSIGKTDIFYAIESCKGKFEGNRVYLVRTELMNLVDYGIRQMTEKERIQLCHDHGLEI